MAEVRIAGLELGGTKCLALLAEGTTIVERVRVPTTTPDETLARLDAVLGEWWRADGFAALGLASFGPLGLDARGAEFGRITTTPKPGWAGTDLRGRYARRFPVPVGFDTDVAGAALAEHRWGAARSLDCAVYLTIGTGVGGGAIVNGRPLHGLLHPEMGHARVPRQAGDPFAGTCPIHGDCIEGLVSGPAIAARAGRPADALDPDDPVWANVAHDLGGFLAMLILTLSPQRIALGGGVALGQPGLIARARTAALAALAGYVAPVTAATIATLVAPACFGADAGPLGAIALGADALAAAA